MAVRRSPGGLHDPRWVAPSVSTVFVFVLALLYLILRAPGLDRFLVNADQGYQLSLAQQTLLGRFPFIDLVLVYGPLVPFTSALALRISGNLIGEVLTCAFMYAISIALIHTLAKERISHVAGWITPVMALLLIARFHKWYIWFFPLVVLYCFNRQLDNERRSSKWWVFGGLISGIGALFRLDYGLAFFVFHSVMVFLGASTGNLRKLSWQRSWASMAATMAFPILLWLGVLAAGGGSAAIGNYFKVTVTGGAGAVQDWSLPLPEFLLSDPFSRTSAHAVALALLPLSYIASIALGAWRGYLRSGGNVRPSRFMVATGLIGLGIFPHGIYRADLAHFYQVLPPMLLVAPALIRCSWRWLRSRSGRGFTPARAVVLTGLIGYVFSLFLTLPLFLNKSSDLAPLSSNPIVRYRDLSNELKGLERSPRTEARIVLRILQLTAPNDYILITPYATQIYYFSRRAMSGLDNSYFFGVHDDDGTRLRNLEHVRRHPPAVVVVRGDFLHLAPQDPFRLSQPELYEFLVHRYTTFDEFAGGWALLRPKSEHPHSDAGQ